MLPAAAEGQQASVNVYARVVEQVETQELFAAGNSGGLTSGMPASWRWEVRAGAEGSKPWRAPLLAAGSGAGWRANRAPVQSVSYVFAPL
ncbi:MAG TPA: hypothetical protein VF039_11585 [Longimicrobiales bacterium]